MGAGRGRYVLYGVVTVAVLHPASRRAPRLGVSARAGVAAAAMWAGLSLLPPVNVIVDLGAGLTVYALMILATGAVKPEQIRGILASFRRPSGATPRDG